ncbi:MAG: OAM dimerization domain-containing protein [Candidatus Izemoplasmatales bacterium]|jgi:beta-lysine 5,6-aminomutase beta subunit|nr:OAM dimerization domain-containing protein [Candidatus Izemoplasmatales bacterium]MDD3865130.1 OAM dimerization domain-containing protein [Candidatus Izemoplasmatales bacterium]
MKIKPYGDTSNDGKVQLSFTLPIKIGALGMEAAKQLGKQMGLIDPSVVSMEAIGENFSFYIVYGSVTHQIDLSLLKVAEITTPTFDKEAVEKLIADHFDRDLVFIGASTGTDAHTVGIDAIMNMKGYAGHYGLERYAGIKAYNLGSQVPNEVFIREAKRLHADVLLISQTVTQKDVHLKNMVELVELLEAEHMRNDVILVCGGARISHELAKELGYDAGFGPGKFAEDVASFAVLELIRKKNKTKK